MDVTVRGAFVSSEDGRCFGNRPIESVATALRDADV